MITHLRQNGPVPAPPTTVRHDTSFIAMMNL